MWAVGIHFNIICIALFCNRYCSSVADSFKLASMAEKCLCSLQAVVELLFILLSTLTYAGKVGVCVCGWWGEPSNIALSLSLPSAFVEYSLPISPSTWTQALWLVIFAWEGLWLAMAWIMLFRRQLPRLVFPGFYPAFALACLLHIGWVFAWGKRFPELSLALVGLQTLVLLGCIAMLTAYLYYVRGTWKFYYRCNFWMTRVLVLNATVAYATFSFLLMLFNLAAVLTKNAELAQETSSTILLSVLSSSVVTYFLLENTILDRFLRYVFAGYLVVLWTLAGVLEGTWQGVDSLGDRNQLFALVLTCVVGALLLARVFLWCVFVCVRPLPDYEKDELDELPQ